MDLSFVLPTHNEKPNLEKVLPDLQQFISFTQKECEIIVVDDASTDGTPEFVRETMKEVPSLFLISRQGKYGIGSALREGYNRACGNYILSMDVDGSIMIPQIKPMLDLISSGADLVVGSKYQSESTLIRHSMVGKIQGFVSRVGSQYMRAVTQVPLSDFNTNFRVIRSDVWRKLSPIENGNFFLAEMAIQAHQKGYRVAEIPIYFGPRLHGKSKTQLWRQSATFLSQSLRYGFWKK